LGGSPHRLGGNTFHVNHHAIAQHNPLACVQHHKAISDRELATRLTQFADHLIATRPQQGRSRLGGKEHRT
jgi:hypothetical protein